MGNPCFYCGDEVSLVCEDCVVNIEKMHKVKTYRVKKAAPLLLEALKKIVEKCDTRQMIRISYYHMVCIKEIAQAAIDVVEGEEEK